MSKRSDQDSHSKWVQSFMEKIPYTAKLTDYLAPGSVYPDLPIAFRASLPHLRSSAKIVDEPVRGLD